MTNQLAQDVPELPGMLPELPGVKIYDFIMIFGPENIKICKNTKFFNDPEVFSGCFRPAEHV